MVFSAPQWVWRADDGHKKYGFVHNTVFLNPNRGLVKKAYVVIPTEFFQLIDVLFPGEERAHAATHGLQFFLDQMKTEWVFGVETLDGHANRDLWWYAEQKLPAWAELALASKF
jgi:hypothetical protein